MFAVAAILLIAYSCRIIGNNGYYGTEVGLLRSFIFISLFAAWGASLYNRIIQTRIRCYMSDIALLMIFWFIIRTLKYYFISAELYPGIVRHLWYMYYLAMLFIPLLIRIMGKRKILIVSNIVNVIFIILMLPLIRYGDLSHIIWPLMF